MRRQGEQPGPHRRGLLATVCSVAGLTLLSRALGFLRWVVQATTVGAGTVAGAYATANQVPNVLYEVVVGGALAATVVPLLAAPIAARRPQEANRISAGLVGLVLVVLVPLGALLAVLAGPIASLFPVSVGVEATVQHELVASFLRMFALQIPLYGVGVVLTGVLQAHGCFMWPALAPVLSSLVVMATYALYVQLAHSPEDPGTMALAVLGWGTTVGVAALSLPLLIPVRRLGLSLRPSLTLPRGTVSRVLRLGGAGTWTLMTQQLSVLVVLGLARSGGNTGTAAVYQYTQAVYVLPYAVLVVPLATVLYPRITTAFEAHGPDGTVSARAQELSTRSTSLIVVVAVAAAAMLAAAATGAERFFGLLTQVDGMGASLMVLAPGLVGYSLIYHVTRVLFAADRARDAALATGLGWFVVALASWVAVRVAAPEGADGPATLVGLAVGLSVGMSVAGAALLMMFSRCLGTAVLRASGRILAGLVPTALVASAFARWLSLKVHGTVACLGVSLVGAVASAAVVLGVARALDPGVFAVLRAPRVASALTASVEES